MTHPTDTIVKTDIDKTLPQKRPNVVSPQQPNPQETLDQIAADSLVKAKSYVNDSIAPQGE